MARYCLVIPKLSDECHEVMYPTPDSKKLYDLQNSRPKPSHFEYFGETYSFSDYIIRELTELEIKTLVHSPKIEDTVNRQNNEYLQWLSLNDECEKLGIKDFKIGEKKYHTINREEFKVIVEQEKKQGKFNIEYREKTFSVYHYC